MTDVAGPPVPAGRLSSLPIRRAKAAPADGVDQSSLEVNCNMAQAFEIPTGNRTGPRNASNDAPAEPSKEFPDTLSRSPLPAGPTRPAGSIAGIWVRLRPAASA